MLAQDDYFDAAELGLEELNQYITVNISEAVDANGDTLTGMVTAVLEVQENLKFHADLDRKYPSESPIFTETGELTEDGFRSLEKAVEARYKGEYVELLGDSTEEAYLKFEIALTVPAETTPEELGEKFYEDTALVQFHNESDPGTFGSPYLFGTVIEEYRSVLATA
jgi:hypothetical protein